MGENSKNNHYAKKNIIIENITHSNKHRTKKHMNSRHLFFI